MKKTDKMLMRMIIGSKGQFAATVTIIVAGIAMFIGMSMSAVNMENTVNDYYSECNFADLHVIAENIPVQKVRDIENISGVETAEGRIVLDAPVVTGDAKERVNVRLITTKGSEAKVNICYLLEGRWLRQSGREALAIEQFADARGLKPGDKLKIQPGGAQYTLDIVGVTANPEFIYLMENAQALMPNPESFGIIYVSEALGRQVWGSPGVNEIMITYSDGADEDAIVKSIENQLKSYGIKQIIKREDQMSNSVVNMEITQLHNMSSSVPFMFISVAAFVLVMMIGRMIKRDRIKIGILKAIGYSNGSIIAHYTKYAAIAGFAGGLVGAVLGMVSAGGMTVLFLEYFNIPLLRTGFYPAVVFEVVIAACLFCIVGGLIGSRGVLKILPADSMKSESPKVGKRIFLEALPALWKRFTFSHKLTVKNILRNKRRAGFVLCGIALSYAMMMFITSMPKLVDDMMTDHYKEFQKMEFIVDFNAPVNRSALSDLAHIVDVKRIEGKLEYPFEFVSGNRKQVASIVGLPSDTEFYSFKNTNGYSVPLPQTGVLISENMAGNLKVAAGDVVKLNSFIPGRGSVYVEVKDVIKQTLGMNAYMDIRQMGEKLMEKNAINGAYLDSDDAGIYEKLAKVSKVSSVLSVEESRAAFEEYMAVMNTAIVFMVLFAGVLSFCVVYNSTSIIIGEREHEFSALRVLGLSQNEIFRMILNENNILLVAGIIVGIPLGMFFQSTMSTIMSTDLYTFDMKAGPASIVAATLLTALFVFFAQFATYRKIRRLDLLAALKNRMN